MSRIDERDERIRIFSQRVVDLEAENAGLREQLDRVQRMRTDITFESLVGSLATAAALGEAQLAGRTVASLGLALQSYLAVENGELGIRFAPPELAANPTGLSTATLELAKLPRLDDTAPNLRFVLEEKQRLYAGLAAEGFAPAARLVAVSGSLLASSSAWTLEGMIASAATIAQLEGEVVDALAETRSPAAVTAYRAAVEALAALASALTSRIATAADVSALAAALDATTRAASGL